MFLAATVSLTVSATSTMRTSAATRARCACPVAGRILPFLDQLCNSGVISLLATTPRPLASTQLQAKRCAVPLTAKCLASVHLCSVCWIRRTQMPGLMYPSHRYQLLMTRFGVLGIRRLARSFHGQCTTRFSVTRRCLAQCCCWRFRPEQWTVTMH